MDALRQDDIARARSTPPHVRARQALAAMELGIRLQWRKLRRAMPGASEEAVKKKLQEWLRRDE
jgi:Rv0078B-related antitoxin